MIFCSILSNIVCAKITTLHASVSLAFQVMCTFNVIKTHIGGSDRYAVSAGIP